MNPTGQNVLEVSDLHVAFTGPQGQTEVLHGLSYRLEAGKVLAVVGESGCGKTVHALSLLGLLPPGAQITRGDIFYKGQNLRSLPAPQLRRLRGAEIAMVFQDPVSSLNPIRTVGKQLTEAILAHQDLSPLRARAWAVQMLKKVGIPNPRKRLDDYPFQFSGGQCQRIMLAMALSLRPGLLIADEPTTALDVTIQAQILRLLKTLQQKEQLSAVFITHNLAIVAEVADEVLVLYAGYCVERAPAQALFERPLHPYTQGLLGSLAPLSHTADKLHAIEGTPPIPGILPAGCPFAPRCPRVHDKCRTALPDLFEKDGRAVRCWLEEPHAHCGN